MLLDVVGLTSSMTNRANQWSPRGVSCILACQQKPPLEIASCSFSWETECLVEEGNVSRPVSR